MGRSLARPLLFLGLLAAVLGASVLHATVVADVPYDLLGSSRPGWAAVYLAVLAVGAYGVGLPELPTRARSAAVAGATAAFIAATVISAAQLALGAPLLPRFVIGSVSVVCVPWSVVCSRLARDGAARAAGLDRVLVLATAAEAAALRDDLDRNPERPARVVAALEPDEARPPRPGVRPVCDAALAHGATVVVLSRETQADDCIVAQVADLHEQGVRVRTLTLFYEEWLGKFPAGELERMSLMFDIGAVHRARYARVKRVVDVAGAVVGLGALVMVTPVVAVGNLVGNRGPLLFRQERVGQRGRRFTMLKFRTMRPGAGGEWTAVDDPRITPFGRFLRRSHLDELPQVLNVLRGDLSLVGPRPEQPAYVAELVGKLPFYDLRHLVRPGVTGWAQVKFGYAGSAADALEKLQYEFFYLRRQSLALDVRILGRTVRSVIGRRGR